MDNITIAGIALTEDCPVCTVTRELLARAWHLMRCDRSNTLRQLDPKQPTLPDQLNCLACRNRGRVLTAEGQALLQFWRDWSKEPIKEEMPF